MRVGRGLQKTYPHLSRPKSDLSHPGACSVSGMKDATKFWQRAARKELRRIDRIEKLEAELAELREAEAFLTWALDPVYRWPTRRL